MYRSTDRSLEGNSAKQKYPVRDLEWNARLFGNIRRFKQKSTRCSSFSLLIGYISSNGNRSGYDERIIYVRLWVKTIVLHCFLTRFTTLNRALYSAWYPYHVIDGSLNQTNSSHLCRLSSLLIFSITVICNISVERLFVIICHIYLGHRYAVISRGTHFREPCAWLILPLETKTMRLIDSSTLVSKF